MANIESAKKRWRQNEKRNARNKPIRTRARRQMKEAQLAIVAGEGVDDAVRSAVRAVDNAVQKGIMHRNTAARRKSRLMRRANAAAAAAG